MGSEGGMTIEDAHALADSLEEIGRHAIFVYQNSDNTYRANWGGREVSGKNPFQLDSRLSEIGAPMRRNLFLIEGGDND